MEWTVEKAENVCIWHSIRKSLHLGFWNKRHIKAFILPKGGENNGPVLTDAALPPLERDVWLASASSLCLLSCLSSRKYANSPRHFRRYSAFWTKSGRFVVRYSCQGSIYILQELKRKIIINHFNKYNSYLSIKVTIQKACKFVWVILYFTAQVSDIIAPQIGIILFVWQFFIMLVHNSVKNHQ